MKIKDILLMGAIGIAGCTEQPQTAKESIHNKAQKEQITTLDNKLEKTLEENFMVYKSAVGRPHNKYTIHKKSFEHDKIDPEQKGETILAIGEPGGIVIINNRVNRSDISDHLILHELTHARKDSIEKELNQEFSDHSAKVISINGRGFKLKNKDGSEQGFPILEEAAAEYIAASFNKHNNRFNPGYFALLTWMRHLEKTKGISPQQVAQAIDEDNYKYIINMCDLQEKDKRAEKVFMYVSKIYRLPINQDGYPEKDLNEVEARVKKFIQKNPSP